MESPRNAPAKGCRPAFGGTRLSLGVNNRRRPRVTEQSRAQRAQPGAASGPPAQGKTFVARGVVFALKNASVKILCSSAGGV